MKGAIASGAFRANGERASKLMRIWATGFYEYKGSSRAFKLLFQKNEQNVIFSTTADYYLILPTTVEGKLGSVVNTMNL